MPTFICVECDFQQEVPPEYLGRTLNCPKCKTPATVEPDFDPAMLEADSVSGPAEARQRTDHGSTRTRHLPAMEEQERRYATLQALAWVHCIAGIGAIVLGFALVPAIINVGGDSPFAGLAICLSVSGGIIAGIPLIAFGQLIDLLIDTEVNTRQSAENSRVTAETTRQTADLLARLQER